MIANSQLDFWIKNNLNVLFIGEAGVGKTSRVIDAFNRNNLKFQYYSSSTLDPWVDFCGIPKEVTDENGNKYIDLVRPKCWAEDEVEAIFLDEYNRAPVKVRNAVMELIQFKSINGKKFNKLRFIWAAINPENSEFSNTEYDVEPLDPAQKDRFQIHIEIPYEADLGYFKNQYGSQVAKIAVTWWNNLSKQTKAIVSPRRLDYALSVFAKKGDIKYVLPKESNPHSLATELEEISFIDTLEELYKQKNKDEAKKFLIDSNSFTNTIKTILDNKNYSEFFIPLMQSEDISSLLSQGYETVKKVTKLENTNENIKAVINSIITANQSKNIVKNITKARDIINGKKSETKTKFGKGVRRFENTANGSSKYWEIKKLGTYEFQTRWGKISANETSEFYLGPYYNTKSKRDEQYDKLIQQKLNKGYIEITDDDEEDDIYDTLLSPQPQSYITQKNKVKDALKNAWAKANDIDTAINQIFDNPKI